ncbi:MAG: PmoA family protein [Pirellulales bacterium]|nr:PmoA family protein [Pirellulales bacterium]
MMYYSAFPLLFACMVTAAASAAAAEITAEKTDQGVVVKIDGQFFTEYLTCSGSKPILWPVIGPTGKPVTRAWPMQSDNPDERQDHPHQRSIWFTHGDVNGIDFWGADPKNPKIAKPGTAKHREFVAIESGAQAKIVTRNDWLGPDGKKVLEDERRLAFGADGESRWIDFDITLKATEGPVTFGDTKEGTMGVRTAESVKVDAKKGGQIVNSDGLIDKDAWGKRAAWVDYFGPVDGETVGIAFMNHPSSFRFPTYWHVRTYGLYAANPFGVKDFTQSKSEDGAYTVPTGESITLKYRLLFHKGDAKQGKVSEAFEAYAGRSKS